MEVSRDGHATVFTFLLKETVYKASILNVMVRGLTKGQSEERVRAKKMAALTN